MQNPVLLQIVSFTFLVVRGGGRDGNVIPLGQSVGIPNKELLTSGDFPQNPVENLQFQNKKKYVSSQKKTIAKKKEK